MKDQHIHACVAFVMVLLYTSVDSLILPTLAVVITWFLWELGQRISKDEEKRGFLYWYRIDRWGSTAIKEFVWPAVTAIITGGIIYALDQVLIFT